MQGAPLSIACRGQCSLAGRSATPACRAEGNPTSRRSHRLRQQGRPAPREQALEQRRVLEVGGWVDAALPG